MPSFLDRLIPRSVLLVLLGLTLAAVLAFAAVSHLVTRFNANQQSRGRKLYAQGLADLGTHNADRAIDEFRAALTCDHGNSQYQLSLGRALRDTGRLDEAESYLLTLWERTPEAGTINLALGRVAARRNSVEDAIRYYHNAIYGVWDGDAEPYRRNARIELVEFLLQRNALKQAQSELVALSASLPADPALHLRAAQLLAQAQDYPDALAEYEIVIRLDRTDAASSSATIAEAGAGEGAYHAGRYRTAQHYLQSAIDANPQDANSRKLLDSANLVLNADPFVRHISDAERNRRISAAFAQAGESLTACVAKKGSNLPVPDAASPRTPTLSTLQFRWNAMKPDLSRLRSAGETDLPDSIMDLVFQIESQTARDCGEPAGADEALLLISRNREAADQ